MSSQLSLPAIHTVLRFVDDDSRRTHGGTLGLRDLLDKMSAVSRKWGFVYGHYYFWVPKLPLGYLRTLELALYLDNNRDIREVFEHGQPLTFETYIPRLIIQRIMETFQQLKEEPQFLDVVIQLNDITARWVPPNPKDTHIADLWPEAYLSHVPCRTCTVIKSGETIKPVGTVYTSVCVCSYDDRKWCACRIRQRKEAVRFVIETFHMPSKHFKKQLLVELFYEVEEYGVGNVPSSPNGEKAELCVVVIRLVDGACGGDYTRATARSNKSVLIVVPDLALDVYAFLDRTHVGTSLVASRSLNALILKLRHHLPVHHLGCWFRCKDSMFLRWKPDPGYQLVLHRYRRGLKYRDERRFELPSGRPPASDCDLILGQLSNSHVSSLKPPKGDYRFSTRMLAALTAHNVSVGELRLQAYLENMTDYRSVATIFGRGGLRMSVLDFSMDELDFARLIKTTDFLRSPAIRALSVLKLTLCERSIESRSIRDERINPPLWINGIYMLPTCSLYEVYMPFHRSEPDARKLVQVCERFERGAITDTLKHFILKTDDVWTFPFKDANRIVSGLTIPARVRDAHYTWDVYRFRNAVNDEWLTACVGLRYNSYYDSRRSVVHIMKGETVPDASFEVDFMPFDDV